MTFEDILHSITLGLSILVSLCYGYQLLYLLLPLARRSQQLPQGHLLRYGVLIAARNEETVLPYLLQSIRAQDYPGQVTVFVVADNCTDSTARVAAEAGAVCYVRHGTRQGKGYALEFLLEKIRQSEHYVNLDAFLIFDADNVLQPDYISQINRVAARYDAFCGFRNSKNFADSWVSMGHSLWFLHDSVHLNHSRMTLGNPCVVTGTGFGFTRQLLERCGGWHFLTLTEDIEFSTWCLLHKISVGYAQQARLFDEQPVTLRQSWRQRTRWVQGGVQVSLRYGADLLKGMLGGGRGCFPCLEALTLSLWGYGLGALCGLLRLAEVLLFTGWAEAAVILAAGLVWTAAGSFLMGVLTLALTWQQIQATTGQKLWSAVVFPLFMLTYVPIGVTAVFRKYHWPPICHTKALSQQELCSR